MKKKLCFSTLVLSLFVISGFSQAPDVSWIKLYRPVSPYGTGTIGYGFDGHQLSDQGYIATGLCVNPYLRAYLVRANSGGDSLWTKQHFTDLPAYGNFTATDVEKTNDGGYFITGHGQKYTEMKNVVWILKVTSNGDTLWSRFFSTAQYDSVLVTNDMKIAPDNGVVIAGTMGVGIGVYEYAFILKYSADGNFQWFKTYGNGTIFEEGLSIENAISGGYALVTRYDSAGVDKVRYRKLSSTGETEICRIYQDQPESIGDYLYIRKTNDNNYVICGSDWGDYFLMKINEAGEIGWFHTYLGTSEDEKAHCVYQTSDNGYVLCGSKVPLGGSADISFILKTSSLGEEEWTKFVTINDFGQGTRRIEQTTDGGYIIFGSARQEAGGADYLMMMKLGGSSGLESDKENLLLSRLDQNFPNPFSQGTEINWFQNQKEVVHLGVFDLSGRELAILVNEVRQAGEHTFQFNPEGKMKPGVYYYRLETKTEILTRKMVFIK